MFGLALVATTAVVLCLLPMPRVRFEISAARSPRSGLARSASSRKAGGTDFGPKPRLETPFRRFACGGEPSEQVNYDTSGGEDVLE